MIRRFLAAARIGHDAVRVVDGVGMAGWGPRKWACGLVVGTIACAVGPFMLVSAHADTLEGALVQAYQNNPALNSQRASVRATDENVPQALSGYRPKVTVTGSVGPQYLDTTTRT